MLKTQESVRSEIESNKIKTNTILGTTMEIPVERREEKVAPVTYAI